VDHLIAAGIQGKHTPAVLANQLLLEPRWGRPCPAYNACIDEPNHLSAIRRALQPLFHAVL